MREKLEKIDLKKVLAVIAVFVIVFLVSCNARKSHIVDVKDWLINHNYVDWYNNSFEKIEPDSGYAYYVTSAHTKNRIAQLELRLKFIMV